MTPPDLNLARLDAFLRSALPGLEGTPCLQPIAGGQSNPTFFLTYDNRALVLRKQPPGPLLPSAHAIDREYRVISRLADSPVPVPPSLLYGDDREIVGTPFYVMEKVEGRVFHDCTLPGLPPEDRRAMYLAMAETLAELHNVDPAAVGLEDYGRPGDFFARQIARWTRQWRENRTRDDANVETLIAWLPNNLPGDQNVSLVHGDYRTGNLMFAPDGPRIVALLDWELSTLGHPLADLAHCALAWLSRPDEYGGLLGLDLDRLGIPDLDRFEQAYLARAKHGQRLTRFHKAFALFRWSMIFEGIAARAAAGTAASADASNTGRLSQAFARSAVAML